jgi:hypothetical protein
LKIDRSAGRIVWTREPIPAALVLTGRPATDDEIAETMA